MVGKLIIESEPNFQEIIEGIWHTIRRVKSREIQYQQGNTELTGFKYMIQAIILERIQIKNKYLKGEVKHIIKTCK